jgi:hypothetical protein
LQRLLNGTTVTASPRQRQRTRRAPGQAAERQGHQLRIQTRGNSEPFSRGIGDRSPIRSRHSGRYLAELLRRATSALRPTSRAIRLRTPDRARCPGCR